VSWGLEWQRTDRKHTKGKDVLPSDTQEPVFSSGDQKQGLVLKLFVPELMDMSGSWVV
jgi:hypothetical protein